MPEYIEATAMKDHKKNKQAILQELESIKSFLTEGELDSIPVLKDTAELSKTELASAIDDTDIPILTSLNDASDADAELLPVDEKLTTKQELDSGLSIESPLDNKLTHSEAIKEIIINDFELNESNHIEAAVLEPIVAPDALPGQRSLFQLATKVKDKVNAEAKSHSEETLEVDTDNEAKQNSASTSNKEVALNSENPFLPKHIRDRLHTQKSLIDIIKDDIALETIVKLEHESKPTSASDTSKALNALDHAIEVTITEYLPKIEARLRQKIKHYLEEDAENARKLSTKVNLKDS
jgi:hypothetical protein